MNRTLSSLELHGTVLVPPSKSDAQRAILAAGIAKGESVIHNIGSSDDETQMLKNIQLLGARAAFSAENRVGVCGGFEFADNRVLNAGESGLGLRLITPVASLYSKQCELDGEGSLLLRPQYILENQLSQLGVRVRSTNGNLPFYIDGSLKGGKLNVDGSVSSQFLSGLLMALPLCQEDSELIVTNLKSVPYVQMTLNTLDAFGIQIKHEQFEVFNIEGSQSYVPTEYKVEGDWSSASYWLVASAIGHDIHVDGLSTRSLQADKAILAAFREANCEVSYDDTRIRVDGTRRTSFNFDCTHSPDLFPALVALAAHCEGVSVLHGVDRLKHKESDRGLTLQSEFAKLGVEIKLVENSMFIKGGLGEPNSSLSSHNDHRIAMSLAIAQSKGFGAVELKDAQAVSKSYPHFWQQLDLLSV
jgi:3-phosphoshikimate 1-carboxyvinyltransferase